MKPLDFLGRTKKILFSLGIILSYHRRKSLAVFFSGSLLLMLILVIPVVFNHSVSKSKKILGVATSGFDFLQSGQISQASQNFDEARKQLRNSQDILLQIGAILPIGQQVDDVLEAGSHISSAGNFLAEGVKGFQDTRLIWDPNANSSSGELYLRLKLSRENLVQSLNELETALRLVNNVSPILFPRDYEEKFLDARAKLRLAYGALDNFVRVEGLLLNLVGGSKKTYLLVFQNNSEARATGGFIGTYGILEFENGQMSIKKIESIYNLDGQLREKIAAPGPLQRQVAKFWGLRDSNWFADFPSSSRKMLEFLEKEGGILADGVISMTPDVFEKLLKITGPLDMPVYGVTLSSENFREVVQYKTSVDYDKELNQPKKLLSDFAPSLLARFQAFDQNQWLAAADVFSEAVDQKNLMAFSIDPALESQFRYLHAGGEIKQTEGDYLAIFHSNVGGGKTDQKTSQTVDKKVEIREGLAKINLRITRSHQDFDEKYFPKNLDYMRILVPAQAKLIVASGFDTFELLASSREDAKTDPELAGLTENIKFNPAGMYEGVESGYKVFSNWLELDPGEEKTVELVYEVPLDFAKPYTQLLQKQPGSLPFEFSLEIDYLPGHIQYFYPETFSREGNNLYITQQITGDRFYGVVGE